MRPLRTNCESFSAAHRFRFHVLGTVSLIGPTRMDYATAIRSVRGAAALLSEFVEQVYE